MAQLLGILMLTSVFVVATADSALGSHGGCEKSWPDTAAVVAAPAASVVSAKGNDGSATVTDNLSLNANVGIQVESLYLWQDGNDFIEFGWYMDRPIFVTHQWVFDARAFEGVYAARTNFDPANGNHTFRMLYNSSSGRFDFRYDGVLQNFHRDPPWVASARPNAVMEVGYQCDTGAAHWWSLDRQRQNGTWDPWNGTGWICDETPNYGYDPVSATESRVSHHTDTYWSAFCNPFSAPN